MFRSITRNILLLGIISLFNDVSSEMLYPVMPLFLRSVGFTFVGIGLIEGLAEATAGLGKIYFGNLSDQLNRRKKFVILGYGSSALSKVMLIFAKAVPFIFFVRLLDRLGKGIRTAPRDAMLAHQSSKENMATIFGFHRAMDTAGACLGPAIALFLLRFHPAQYRTLFWYAALPALIGVAITFIVKEIKVKTAATKKEKPSLFKILTGREIKSKGFFKLIAPYILFALANSSDMFLLLWVKKQGLGDSSVITLYILYNVTYALSSYPAGIAADKWGKRKLLVIGFTLFALVYSCFYFCHTFWQFTALFAVYGIYTGLTDGNTKAVVSEGLQPAEKASGLGFLAGWQSIALLLASSWTGLLWNIGFILPSFIISAAAVLVVTIWIATIRNFAKPTTG